MLKLLAVIGQRKVCDRLLRAELDCSAAGSMQNNLKALHAAEGFTMRQHTQCNSHQIMQSAPAE